MQMWRVSSNLWARTVCAALAFLRIVHPTPALACGGGGITSEVGVVIDAQHVVISSRAAGTTDIVAYIDVPEATSDFGWLIPVPSEPTLDPDPIPSEELASLAEATAPTIIVKDPEGDAPLIGCGSSKSGGDRASGVTSSPFVEVGPVVAVSLKGDSASEVEAWLEDNGFTLTQADSHTLERYVAYRSYFIAVKRNTKVNDGAPSSIGLHYSLTGDHRLLSLGFAQIGADDTVSFTLFLANPVTMGPSAPFQALTLDDLDAALLKVRYSEAVSKAVAARDSKAFVIESSTPASQLRPMLPHLSKLFDDGATITRATTVVSRNALTTDALFASPFTSKVPTSRTLSFAAPNTRGPEAQWFAFAFVGALASFSFRRRKP